MARTRNTVPDASTSPPRYADGRGGEVRVEIVVKATNEGAQAIEEAVARRVGEALGEPARTATTVSRLFPGVTRGHRARMLVVRVPDRLSPDEVARLLERLRADDAVEYAELPAEKRPMTGT
jgi:hypothetical protein